MWRLIFLLLFWFVSPRTTHAQLKRFSFTENKMGSPFNLIFYHNDSSEARTIAKECFLIIDTLNSIFSDYSSESEVGKLATQTHNRDIQVSDELYEMIRTSKMAWIKSGKTFDITIGALSQFWRKVISEDRFPDYKEIKAAKKSTGFINLSYDDHVKTISFKKPGIRLDFGGIVKGYAAQKVIDYLKKKGINSALADAGGDIAVSDAPPGKNGWSISINLPQQTEEFWDKQLELKNCAVATSGDLYKYIERDRIRFSHIIDPRTGYGITSQKNVTIIAKDGTTADWLATACSILSVDKALALAENEKAALLIAQQGAEGIVTHKTKDFDSFFQKKEQ